MEKIKTYLQKNVQTWLPAFLFLITMFLLGGAVGAEVTKMKQERYETEAGIYAQKTSGIADVAAEAGLVGGKYGAEQLDVWGQPRQELLLNSENWGLGFGKEGSQPTGNATAAELLKYDAYFVDDIKEKIIYLTFDCGYENGNTAPILDALKKHNAPATFFVVGHYLESASELVKRMVEEGHTVGNHTYHHPDMSKISDRAAFQKEMDDVKNLFKEVTGTEISMYYRPPQGKYSTSNLQMAKDLGYSTFFWSLAYVDWNADAQPSHEEALEKLGKRIHPGAIVLLHTTSKTNGEIMDELLSKWEEMGYGFGRLEDVKKGSVGTREAE